MNRSVALDHRGSGRSRPRLAAVALAAAMAGSLAAWPGPGAPAAAASGWGLASWAEFDRNDHTRKAEPGENTAAADAPDGAARDARAPQRPNAGQAVLPVSRAARVRDGAAA